MNRQGFPVLIGRALPALMFLLAGISKFADLGGTADYIAARGLPMAQSLAIATAALEVGAGALLLIGWQARWAALALAAFAALAAVIFHDYWAMPASRQMVEQLFFMKDMSIAGGMLVLFAFGPGTLSLDQRRARS